MHYLTFNITHADALAMRDALDCLIKAALAMNPTAKHFCTHPISINHFSCIASRKELLEVDCKFLRVKHSLLQAMTPWGVGRYLE